MNDYRTVFVFPSDPDDTQPFDPTKSYKQVGIATSSSYYLPATEIPTSYLKTPCFVAGTLIDTARGPRPVETLRAGDLVVTRDRGVRPLCWAGRRMLSAQHLRLAPHLRPVRIRAGALGPGLPARDLFVSPQHRVLLRSALAARHCGAAEVLVAALHLCSLRGVRQHDPPDGVAYHHLLFDRHEIVRSNGCWSESLYTGPQAMLSLSPQARQEIAALYPHLIAPGAEIRPGARPFLAGRQGRDIAQAHRRTGAPLFSAAETKDPRIPA
ncbi:Hint domain-containing protein [Paracoccus isoporae]|uniref:Hint domain-containing protein n=1 Tax=Paracoccus isoporae TaxID=591205 RepID=UPI0015A1383F|nr:Hint domain-containing protein [Paracoccus isoporae]